MPAVLGGGGYAAISDPVFTEINSQIEIQSGRTDLNDYYIFQGTCRNSQSSVMLGKAVIIKVQVWQRLILRTLNGTSPASAGQTTVADRLGLKQPC